MKSLLLPVLLAVGCSAGVPVKRGVVYPPLYSIAIPYIANDVNNQFGVWLQYEPIPPLTAVVDIKNYGEGSEVTGKLTLTQLPGGPVFFSGNITGLEAGAHGFHIHEFGDLSKGCESLGAHFNPTLSHHGGPADPFRHVGDLGNIEANSEGLAKINDSDHLISLSGPNSVVGRGLVIHAKKDDYGRGGDKESLRTGNAGARVACGVIAWAQPAIPAPPATPKPQGDADTEVVEP